MPFALRAASIFAQRALDHTGRIALVPVLCLVLLTPVPALADDYVAGSGAWGEPSTWTPEGVPGPGDTATVNGEVYTVEPGVRGMATIQVGELTVNGSLLATQYVDEVPGPALVIITAQLTVGPSGRIIAGSDYSYWGNGGWLYIRPPMVWNPGPPYPPAPPTIAAGTVVNNGLMRSGGGTLGSGLVLIHYPGGSVTNNGTITNGAYGGGVIVNALTLVNNGDLIGSDGYGFERMDGPTGYATYTIHPGGVLTQGLEPVVIPPPIPPPAPTSSHLNAGYMAGGNEVAAYIECDGAGVWMYSGGLTRNEGVITGGSITGANGYFGGDIHFSGGTAVNVGDLLPGNGRTTYHDGEVIFDPQTGEISGDALISGSALHIATGENLRIGPFNNHPAITAETSLYVTVASGGTVDFSGNDGSAAIMAAGEDATVQADNVVLEPGVTLDDLIDTPTLNTEPGARFAGVVLGELGGTLQLSPGDQIWLPIVYGNGSNTTETIECQVNDTENWLTWTLDRSFEMGPQYNLHEWIELTVPLDAQPMDYTELTVTVATQTPGASASTSLIVQVPRDDYGDMNCDGALNGFDIDPFIMVIGGNLAGYYAAFPDCTHLLADVNQDGNIDGFDIDPFIVLLGGG